MFFNNPIYLAGLVLGLAAILYCVFRKPWILFLSAFAALYIAKLPLNDLSNNIDAAIILFLILFYIGFSVAWMIRKYIIDPHQTSKKPEPAVINDPPEPDPEPIPLPKKKDDK